MRPRFWPLSKNLWSSLEVRHHEKCLILLQKRSFYPRDALPELEEVSIVQWSGVQEIRFNMRFVVLGKSFPLSGSLSSHVQNEGDCVKGTLRPLSTLNLWSYYSAQNLFHTECDFCF